MKIISIPLIFSFLAIISSCQTSEKENTPDFTVTDNNNLNTIDPIDNTSNYSNEYEETPVPNPKSEIEWQDGSTYSYDYTETITQTDSLGNMHEITVYKQNKPTDAEIYCSPKFCKWCGKESTSHSYTIEEYPNINWLRGQIDFGSIIGIIGNLFDGTHYYDLDNNKVRTEWKINCEYYGPDNFCSNKCEYDYKNK
jgi:hypothetical protein